MKGLFSINSPLWEMTDKIVRLLWLGILWALCCIPVITIGPSTTALYSVTLKYVRGEEGYLTSSFFHAFRKNFKQSSLAWGISLAVGSFLFADFVLYSRLNLKGIPSAVLFTVFAGILAAFILANIFLYPLLAYFDNTLKRTLLNSLIMAVCHLPSSIAMLSFTFAVLVAGSLFFPPLLLLAPGLTAYINSRFLRKIFERYQPVQETAS